MASQIDEYRLLNRLDLAPSFISLGLRPELFRDGGDADATSFNAALSGPTDMLWLFRGGDVLAYDLRADRIVEGPTPIASRWAVGAMPADFAVGIDSAVWLGPSFPNIVCLFRGDRFLRLDCSSNPADPRGWTFDLEPTSTHQEWLRAPGTNGDAWDWGDDFGPAAKLYGLRDAQDRVHWFSQDGRYARHDLTTGQADITTRPTQQVFPLPASFGGRVDLAFYGTGAEAEHIFLFSRADYAEYDLRRGAVVRTGAIEQRFPALAPFIVRPQLFLVEDYALDVYVGPLALGRLVSTLLLPPNSRRTSVVETRVTAPAKTALHRNLLEGPSDEVIADFYAKVSAGESVADVGVDRLRQLLGDRAGLWGGEAAALSGERGGIDAARQRLADLTFAAMAEQARDSTHRVEQQLISSDAAAPDGPAVVTRETYELANTGDQSRQIEFMELLQAYATLLRIENVRAAYTNGRDRPDIMALRELDRRLPDLLVDPADAGPVLDFLKEELARIQDSTGSTRAIVVPNAELAVDARVDTVFVFDDCTPPQRIEVAGIVKAARQWRQPTYQTRPVDVVADQPAGPRTAAADVTRVALSAPPDIAAAMPEAPALPS